MFAILIQALVEIFRVLIPIAVEKANEATVATDAPDVPAGYTNAWADRVRRFKSRIRGDK